MKKLIEYPDSIQKELNILAAKSETSLIRYIEDLLVSHVREAKLKEFKK